MKVFVNNVDLPLGRAISRLLAHTPVGLRVQAEEEEGVAGDEENAANPNNQQPYEVVGTLSRQPSPQESENDDGFFDFDIREAIRQQQQQQQQQPSMPGAIKPKTAAGTGTILPQHSPNPNSPSKIVLANRQGVIPVPDVYQKGTHKPSWVQSAFPYSFNMPKNELDKAQEELKQVLLDCDIIVYDIHQRYDEANWAIEFLNSQQESFPQPKKFILISNVMTWAKTKQEDGSDVAFTEEDFRKRKAHPNYKDHLSLEKNVTKYGKTEKLKTVIINSGLVYHVGDGPLHNFIKAAWLNIPELPIFGEGDNTIPMIHLNDLANVVVEVVDTKSSREYILAVDEAKTTLLQLVRSVSEHLGTGKIKHVSKEEIILRNDFTQTELDLLQVHVRLDPSSVGDMQFEWVAESGAVENIENLVKEYKGYRKLHPINIFVSGPPYSGKSTYAKKLAEKYELHYVSIEKTMRKYIEELEKKVSAPPLIGEDGTEVANEVEAEKTILDEIKSYMASNDGKFPDAHVLNAISSELKAVPCRNQGYVLDGFPNARADAIRVFNMPEDGGKTEPRDNPVLPHHVINIDLDDEAIKDRAFMSSNDGDANNRPNEEVLLRALADYRKSINDGTSVIDLLDEHEIHPYNIRSVNLSVDQVLGNIVKHIGCPHNYGPSEQQILERKLKHQQDRAQATAQAEEERLKNEKEESERQVRARAEWEQRYREIKKQEMEALEVQSAPLRDYLIKNVMPSLTAALVEVCKVRPEDPIDYVAEYLFRNSERHILKQNAQQKLSQ